MHRETSNDKLPKLYCPQIERLLENWSYKGGELPSAEVARAAQGLYTTPLCRAGLSLLICNWIITIYAPTWLAIFGKNEVANKLSGLQAITHDTELETAKVASGILRDEFDDWILPNISSANRHSAFDKRLWYAVENNISGATGAYAAHYSQKGSSSERMKSATLRCIQACEAAAHQKARSVLVEGVNDGLFLKTDTGLTTLSDGSLNLIAEEFSHVREKVVSSLRFLLLLHIRKSNDRKYLNQAHIPTAVRESALLMSEIEKSHTIREERRVLEKARQNTAPSFDPYKEVFVNISKPDEDDYYEDIIGHINESGIDDNDTGWKTYYVKFSIDGDKDFYKFGKCQGAVKKRFQREKEILRLSVQKIWQHNTEDDALRHEESLFRKHKGDRPFIGSLGPLKHGGNTEVYSHDVFGDQEPPETYIAKLWSIESYGELKLVYADWNPQEEFVHLCKFPLKHFDGPEDIGEGKWYLVPTLSTSERVALATSDFLEKIQNGSLHMGRLFTKKHAADAITNSIIVCGWYDRKSKFSNTWLFNAKKSYGVNQYDNWVSR